MRVTAETSLPQFAELAESWLQQEPLANNVIATVLAGHLNALMTPAEDIRLLRINDQEGVLVGVAVQTPPWPVLVSHMTDEAARALAGYVHAAGWTGGFNGPVATARMAAETMAGLAGGRARRVRAMSCYRLHKVIPPRATPGCARAATAPDLDLVAQWSNGFHADIGGQHATDSSNLARRIARGNVFLWERDGHPVAMAGRSDPAGNLVRINLVYTPQQLRGNGYASALVAHIGQTILDSRHAVMLYADAANPTSNRIYQTIGFRIAAQTAHWTADTR